MEIINAAGKMTSLGASAVDNRVAAAAADALQRYYDMDQLSDQAGLVLARAAGAEAGLVTASATAAIVVAIAGCVAGENLSRIELLPSSEPPNEVVILRAHVVHFGASIEQMIRVGGGKPLEVGTVNRVVPAQVRAAITERTAAAMYVVSHHVNAEGSLPIETVVDEAHARGVPVIVDAAAEQDLRKYIRAGADLVIYSGQKAIGGPTSGVLVGTEMLVRAARAQTAGIGRAMKVSKEAIVGLVVALDVYGHRNEVAEQGILSDRAQRLATLLGPIPGGSVGIVGDETRPIPRVSLHLGPEASLSAADLVRVLEAGTPSIRTRNHQVAQGTILFDPRPLREGDEVIIAKHVRVALGLTPADPDL